MVVEVGGVTVYPARAAGDRWRAVWYEGGRRRQCQAVLEAGLAAKLERVTERLAADAPGMERPGTDLIAYYLSPGRHPAARSWSRKHADTQRRLCQRYLAPVIGNLVCQDITVADMQASPKSRIRKPCPGTRAGCPGYGPRLTLASSKLTSPSRSVTPHGRATGLAGATQAYVAIRPHWLGPPA